MKLSQVYANKKFKTVKFRDGLNIVLAKVTKRKDLTKDSHNLGKTTLIGVIDFMLLKGLDKSHIFKKYESKFKEHILFLELQLNNGVYLTIRRAVSKPSKISFKTHDIPFQNFTNLDEKEWDEYELPIQNAKNILEKKLSFDVIPDWPYRKSVTYFLRSQYDYNDVFQLQKFARGKDVDWKPFLFDLLGFEGKLLKDKYELELSKEKQQELIKEFKDKLSVDPKETDKIKGAIEIKKEEKEEAEKEIDNFNFYHRERNLNKELIEEIENEISELNSKEYDLTYELEQIEESFKTNSLTKFDDIKKIWEEAKIYFQESAIKDYEELENFNKRITEERQTHLKERFKSLTEKLKEVRLEIQSLNNKRQEVLSVLKEKDSFKKFKEYQFEFSKIDSEIARLEEQLKSIDKIEVLNDTIKDINDEVEELTEKIKKQIESDLNKIYPEIRKNFRNIIKYILDAPAILYLVPNTAGNVEYHAEIQNKEEIEITAADQGFSYKKFLCMAFDLAVLITYSKKSFYRFVYHDGALEGMDNRKKQNFVKLIREQTTKNNLQYIFTAIEDDLPMEFDKNEIAVTLDDSGEGGTLFEMNF